MKSAALVSLVLYLVAVALVFHPFCGNSSGPGFVFGPDTPPALGRGSGRRTSNLGRGGGNRKFYIRIRSQRKPSG